MVAAGREPDLAMPHRVPRQWYVSGGVVVVRYPRHAWTKAWALADLRDNPPAGVAPGAKWMPRHEQSHLVYTARAAG